VRFLKYFSITILGLSLITSCKTKPRKYLAKNQVTLKKAIRTQATEMVTAFIKGDFEKYVGYFPQEIINTIGGIKKMATYMKSKMLDTSKNTFNYKIIKVSDIIKGKDGLVCFLTTHSEMMHEKKHLIVKGYAIARSKNQGKNWRFSMANNSPSNHKYLRERYPILTDLYKFPKCSISEAKTNN